MKYVEVSLEFFVTLPSKTNYTTHVESAQRGDFPSRKFGAKDAYYERMYGYRFFVRPNDANLFLSNIYKYL